MHEYTGKASSLSFDYFENKVLLTLQINEGSNIKAAYDELKQCDKLTIKLSKYREKRSLDANAYCWVLISKLAAKLNKTTTEIYREFIKDIGDNCEVVCVIDKAVEKLCKGWQKNGLGWQAETMPSKIEGCTNVILYYGSSIYDTAQMSRLINNIVEECKEQGIDVRTPDEIADLISLWGENIE